MLKGCRTFTVLLGVLLLKFAGGAEAQIIANVSATASTEYPNREAIHAVDGSGLSPGDNFASTADQTHNTGADGDVWLSTSGDSSPSFTVTFDDVYDVVGFRVFNYNENFEGIGRGNRSRSPAGERFSLRGRGEFHNCAA